MWFDHYHPIAFSWLRPLDAGPPPSPQRSPLRSCLCVCPCDPASVIRIASRLHRSCSGNGIGFWGLQCTNILKEDYKLGICGTPWIPFANSSDNTIPCGDLKEHELSRDFSSWGRAFIFLFMPLFLIYFWATSSPFKFVMPTMARHNPEVEFCTNWPGILFRSFWFPGSLNWMLFTEDQRRLVWLLSPQLPWD